MEPIDVVILYGSPRKRGNSTAIAKKIKEGLLVRNNNVCDFYLHGMNIKPCAACEGYMFGLLFISLISALHAVTFSNLVIKFKIILRTHFFLYRSVYL